MPLGAALPESVLESCYFEDFKSYRKATLPLRPLTLLIGANASGKSNLLEGIQFLSMLSQGRRLDEVWRATHDSEIALRGAQPQNLFRPSCAKLTLGCTVRSNDDWALELTIQLQLAPDGRLQLFGEKLTAGGWWLYERNETQYSGPGVTIRYNNFARGGRKPTLHLSADQSVFMQLQSPGVFESRHLESKETIPQRVRQLLSALSRVQILDSVPSRMRDGSFPADGRLREDGRNVSAVLYNLCQDAAQRNDLLSFVRSLPEQDIRRIDFVKGVRGDVLVKLVESFGHKEQEYDATLLSDGTLRALALGAALLSVPVGTLLVIEEIDNGFHPSRAKQLMANVDRLARLRNLRVLITTHNPALVDALPLSAVPDIVLCHRSRIEGHSLLTRLDDLPDYAALVGRHSVGQLMTEGLLEQASQAVGSKSASPPAGVSAFLQQFLDGPTGAGAAPASSAAASNSGEDDEA